MGRKKSRQKLTKLQVKVINLICAGRSNLDIAQELGRSEQGIKNCLARIYHRFGIKAHNSKCWSRIKLAIYWSWPIFRIGAGYETPLNSAVDVIERDRLRAQENRRQLADPAD